jgi:dihydrofolate reductase
MSEPKISMIAALGENRVIGYENKLLWHIPADMQHFRSLTSGHAVIMGRKTFESIGKPLPNRMNIIITKNQNYAVSSCTVVHSLEDALQVARAHETEEIFVIGGSQIYTQALPYADKLYLTIVKGKFSGDAYFPDYSNFNTILSQREGHDENYTYTFLELEPTQGYTCKAP